ncbi:unnamed protein product [Leuciscus chuanchicus]
MDTGPPGPAVPQTPEWVADVDKLTKNVNNNEEEEEEEMIKSANMEPSTLQWPENKPGPQILPVQDGESVSVRSDCISVRGGVSRTESEREEFGMGEKRKTGEEWREMETGKESISDFGLRNGVKSTCSEIEVEEMNMMPENAARVFNPSITILRSTSQQEAADHWRDAEEERHVFLGTHETRGTPIEGYYHDWPVTTKSRCCNFGGSNRDALKLGVSMFTSALIFPLLVWGGYVFLPFDAPLLDSAPLRLVYTLRCSVFAVIPIVLGMLVLGVSRLWYRSLKPRFEGEREVKQVAVHQRYVEDSISLFLLYFLQLAVMAAYLKQDLLKLIPLLTIVFAFGRLLYWVAAACGSSFRGVGFGFSFLPTLAMLVANLYFIFLSESAGSIFAPDIPETPVPQTKQRFWG